MPAKGLRLFVAVLLVCRGTAAAAAEEKDAAPVPPSVTDLAAITERGRSLAGYDAAVWHATDAVQTANPKTVEGQYYLARLENGGKWTVVFGRLNADKTKFLIHYEAAPGERPKQFVVSRREPPVEDGGFYLFAARALENALRDFVLPARPYNGAVLPATEGQLYVYLYPAQLKADTYPLGGDMRYLFSADGNRLLETRPLHRGIIEAASPKGKKAAGGYHTHVLGDIPEDTDVLHVLQQNPPVPEWVGTPHFNYEIAGDGSITIVKKPKK